MRATLVSIRTIPSKRINKKKGKKRREEKKRNINGYFHFILN